MAKTGKFILGALVGAAAAALLTPLSGRATRSRLSKEAAKRGLDSAAIKKSVTDLLSEARRPAWTSRKTKPKT